MPKCLTNMLKPPCFSLGSSPFAAPRLSFQVCRRTENPTKPLQQLQQLPGLLCSNGWSIQGDRELSTWQLDSIDLRRKVNRCHISFLNWIKLTVVQPWFKLSQWDWGLKPLSHHGSHLLHLPQNTLQHPWMTPPPSTDQKYRHGPQLELSPSALFWCPGQCV